MIAQVLDVVPVLDEVPACELLRLADFLRGEACHRLHPTSLLRGLRTGGSLPLGLQALAIGLEALWPEAYRIAAGERPDGLGQAVGARH
jgi:hypothetical protein